MIQATVAKLYKLYTANQGFRLYRRALIMENKWRAARYGLDGKLIDFGKQKEIAARELVAEYLEFIDDVVDELGSREEIESIHKILAMGTGADRQIAVWEATNDIRSVVDHIVLVAKADQHDEAAVARLIGRLGLDAKKVRGAVLTGADG